MTRSLSGAEGAAASPFAFSLRKVPRERLIRLTIEADICPQILLRVLGLVAQQSRFPLAIGYESKDHSLAFDIIVDGLADRAAETLLYRIQGLANVRSAALSRIPEP